MAGFAIVCPEASISIAAAINTAVAVPATPVKIARIDFGLCIVNLPTIAPIHSTFSR